MKSIERSAIYFEALLYAFIIFCAALVWRGETVLQIIGGIGLAGISWAALIEPHLLITRKDTVKNKELNGLRMGLVSDIHVGVYRSRRSVERIVKKINKLEPDALLIPGDFLYGRAKDFAKELAPLAKLNIPFYFTLGNHDHVCDSGKAGAELLRKTLISFGGVDLNNRSERFNEKLWIAGVDDNYLGRDDLGSALLSIPKNKEIILLAHSPDIVDDSRTQQVSLIVSGHTHGGQIRMPWGIVPQVVPVKNKKYDRGYFPEKKLIVTSGAGETGTRCRFLNPPEIRIISFK